MQWYNIQAKDMATYRPNWPRGQKNVKKKYCIVQYNIAITVQHRNVWVQSTPTV